MASWTGILLFSLLLSLTSVRTSRVEQRQQPISVPIGADLQLECLVPESLLPGPVKWFLGKGPHRKLIYPNKQKPENHERIKRVFPESGTDFTIGIRNVTLEDAGMYYCVKQRISSGSNKDLYRGDGTLVVVINATQENSVTPIAAGASSVLLLLLLGLFLMALYFYVKKKRGRSSSNRRSGGISSSDQPTNPVQLQRSDTNFPKKQSSKQGSGVKEIVYAELKEQSGPSPPKGVRSEVRSEYATIQGAPRVDREKRLISV